MEQKTYQKLFRELPLPKIPEGLRTATLLRVEKTRIRAMRTRFIAYSSLGFTSGVALFPLASATLTDIAESGFIDYASLLFSDSGAVLSYWQEFSITLIESLPILGLTMILLALFTLLQSFRLAVKNSGGIFTTHRFS